MCDGECDGECERGQSDRECERAKRWETKGRTMCEAMNKNHKKKAPFPKPFIDYACPAGPKLSGIGGCSVSLISP
jgi:hypothetical protein